MSVRSLPLAVVVAEECGNGVRIGVGAEKFPQRHSLLPGEVENQPAQSALRIHKRIRPSRSSRACMAGSSWQLMFWSCSPGRGGC